MLALIYPRDTTKTDLTYLVESSGDLAIWIPQVDTPDDTNGTIEFRIAEVAVTPGTRTFLRLRVSLAE